MKRREGAKVDETKMRMLRLMYDYKERQNKDLIYKKEPINSFDN